MIGLSVAELEASPANLIQVELLERRNPQKKKKAWLLKVPVSWKWKACTALVIIGLRQLREWRCSTAAFRHHSQVLLSQLHSVNTKLSINLLLFSFKQILNLGYRQNGHSSIAQDPRGCCILDTPIRRDLTSRGPNIPDDRTRIKRNKLLYACPSRQPPQHAVRPTSAFSSIPLHC